MHLAFFKHHWCWFYVIEPPVVLVQWPEYNLRHKTWKNDFKCRKSELYGLHVKHEATTISIFLYQQKIKWPSITWAYRELALQSFLATWNSFCSGSSTVQSKLTKNTLISLQSCFSTDTKNIAGILWTGERSIWQQCAPLQFSCWLTCLLETVWSCVQLDLQYFCSCLVSEVFAIGSMTVSNTQDACITQQAVQFTTICLNKHLATFCRGWMCT